MREDYLAVSAQNGLLDLYNRFQKIHVLLDDGDRRSLQDIDLTTSQYNLLLHLATSSPEQLTITNLADRLICSRSNATRMVRRLEEQELVASTRDTEDRRLVLVSMTDEGWRRYLEAKEAHTASVQRRLASLAQEDLQALSALTYGIVKLLEEDLLRAEKEA
jgi:DNA-binding MarR family transcriptional regulator